MLDNAKQLRDQLLRRITASLLAGSVKSWWTAGRATAPLHYLHELNPGERQPSGLVAKSERGESVGFTGHGMARVPSGPIESEEKLLLPVASGTSASSFWMPTRRGWKNSPSSGFRPGIRIALLAISSPSFSAVPAGPTCDPGPVRPAGRRKDPTMPNPVRAVAYYRMSTDRQETLHPRAAREVEAYARTPRLHDRPRVPGRRDQRRRHGAAARLPEDDERRRRAGRLRAVLCWDQDRFGRFDPIEAGYWIKPLRDAGVRPRDSAQGRIDWEGFAGRILYTVQQRANMRSSATIPATPPAGCCELRMRGSGSAANHPTDWRSVTAPGGRRPRGGGGGPLAVPELRRVRHQHAGAGQRPEPPRRSRRPAGSGITCQFGLSS